MSDNMGIAIALLITSLVLLVIYGVDIAVATSSPDRVGFLPPNIMRGSTFGGGAVVCR
jgi:hypothetical protein